MQNTDIIDRLPQELANCLLTDPFFATIPIVVAEKGNIAAEFARAQAVIQEQSGKRGVAVIVLQVVADDLSNNLQFGPMTLKPAFQVIENVELNNDDNGTGLSARKVARKIRDCIKTQNLVGLVLNMTTGKPCIEPVPVGDDVRSPSTVVYQVNFECLEVGQQPMTAVQMPAITGGSNPPQFILTCATPGAQIWYTLDDTFPFNFGPGSTGDSPVPPGDPPGGTGKALSTSILYINQPVNIPAGGCTLRARAYPGAPSDSSIASAVNRNFLPN